MSTSPNPSRADGQPANAVNPMPPIGGSRAVLVYQSILGKSLVVRGEITGSESLHVLGEFHGSIELPGCYVQVGPNSAISSNVTAREVVICGELHGNLKAGERVDVRKGAALIGDVVTNRISIEEGALFTGRIDMRVPESKSGPKASGTATNAAETPLKLPESI